MTLGPGQVLDGKYRVVRLIGEGGMGVVYEGENIRIGRRVAIKVMHADAAVNPEVIRRFEREAQAAARVRSPHVCDVLDLGDMPAGDRYLVMEYLDGESLGQRLDGCGRLEVRDVAILAYQLLDGLASMHEAGIIHRDLKPANIFLARTPKGEMVKVVDFGISKILPSASSGATVQMTAPGTVLGTPLYMSPEQARGQNNAVDVRSDLYAVGVILYRSITGELPFVGQNFQELLFKIALEQACPVEERVPDTDPAFGEIVRKAMARSPQDRFQTAREFQAAIVAWGRAQGRPSLAFENLNTSSVGVGSRRPDPVTPDGHLRDRPSGGAALPPMVDAAAKTPGSGSSRDGTPMVWSDRRPAPSDLASSVPPPLRSSTPAQRPVPSPAPRRHAAAGVIVAAAAVVGIGGAVVLAKLRLMPPPPAGASTSAPPVNDGSVLGNVGVPLTPSGSPLESAPTLASSLPTPPPAPSPLLAAPAVTTAPLRAPTAPSASAWPARHVTVPTPAPTATTTASVASSSPAPPASAAPSSRGRKIRMDL